MDMETTVTICKSLGDANRLRILQNLMCGELCACELLSRLQITQPTLSHHMKILCGAGLVHSRKEGKWMHYSLDCRQLRGFQQAVAGLCCSGNAAAEKGDS